MAELLTLSPQDETVRRAPLLTLAKTGDTAQSPEFAGSQGAKLHLALGDQSPGADTLSASISTGNSYDYKRLLQQRDVIQQQSARDDVLSSIMQADPQSITPEVVQTVQHLSMAEMQSGDIGSIVEKKYAQLYTNVAAASLDNDVFDNSMASNPEGTHDLLDRAESLAFKRNYAATVADQVNQEISQEGLASKTGDFLERLVPFVEWYQKHNAIDGAGDFVSGILPGGNLQAQYSYMWSLSNPQEFKDTLDTVMTEMKSRNLYTAQSWMEGLFSYGSGDAFMDNAFALSDVAATAPMKTLAGALKGVVRAAAKNPLRLEAIATDIGKNADAAMGKNVADLKSGDFFGNNIKNSKELENSIPSIASPEKLLSGADNVPQAAYLRMKEALIERADLAKKFLTEPNLIDRATPEELVQYKDILLDDYVKQHPSIQKNVIDASVSQTADVGNVYQAKVSLGRRDGTLFESEQQALNWGKKYLDTNDFQVTQKGEGFLVSVNKTVDESRFLSDLILGTSQKTPESIANTFGGWWRSPNYTISSENELARSTAVTSHEALDHIFSQLAEPFRKLQKKQMAELEDMMVVNRDKQTYYENYGQFEQAFYDRFKKNPSPEQADTYFAYVQINDLDLAVRDLDWYKQKARLGFENITVPLKDDAGKAVAPVPFEGKVIESLPYGSKDRWAVTFVKDGKASKPVSSKYVTEALKKQVEETIAKGGKIVQVADQSYKVGDRYAGFIVTDSVKRDRIGLLNVDRKPGGHKVHKYPYYIKQGMISGNEESALYRGDRSLFNVTSDKEGRELIEKLEIARKLALDKSPSATAFIRDNLPITPKEFFASVAKGEINLKVPFALTKKGTRTIDTGVYSHLANLTDLAKNEHNLSSRITGSYAGERSTHDLNVIRTEGDTRFVTEPAPYLSPMETLRMSSNNMLSTRVMNDYSISTNQNFIREFSDILKGTKEEQQASGLSLLMNPEFKTGVDISREAAAKNVSRAYNNLLSHGTKLDRAVESYKEKLLSSIMPKFGPRGQQWVEDRMLSRVQDPGQFFRSMAFHMKLGMFNPISYFTQLNSAVNILSIAGRDGFRGAMVYPLARGVLLSSSDDVLRGAARMAEKAGLMKANEFEESMRAFKRSGYNNVGGDTSYLDSVKSPELRRSQVGATVKSVLDAGTTPFKEGERTIRLAAWNAAYLERKKALKGATLSRRDEAMILQRAKDLGGNMSRESNSAWQKGYGSVFSQFMGYQARLTEQMIGKKLSPAEKTRLFAGMSFAYGVPTAVGGTLGVIPVREMINQMLISNGEDPNNDAMEPFLDGFASSMLEYITGTEYNIASRYGSGGLPTFYDLFREDKTWVDVLVGASGGIALQTVADSMPMFQAMTSEFADTEGGYYNLTGDSFLQPLRNISLVNNAVSLYNVYNFHVWASKNGTDITKMDLPDAVFAAVTGLQPATIEDSFAKLRATKDFAEHIKSVQKGLIKDYRTAMKMEDGATREKMIKDIKARMILEGLTPKEQAQTWRYAADNEMMTDVFFQKYEDLQKRKEMTQRNLDNSGIAQ